MFWRSKSLGEALRLVVALRSELDSQRVYYESLLNDLRAERKELMDRLLDLTKKPPAYEPPPLDPSKLSKRGPSRLNFPGYRRSHRPPLPELGDAK